MNVPQSVVAETNLEGRPLLIIFSQIYSRQLRVKKFGQNFHGLLSCVHKMRMSFPQTFAGKYFSLRALYNKLWTNKSEESSLSN